VKFGQIEVLRWLRAQEPPAPWNETVLTRAAASGKVEVVRWVMSQEPSLSLRLDGLLLPRPTWGVGAAALATGPAPTRTLGWECLLGSGL